MGWNSRVLPNCKPNGKWQIIETIEFLKMNMTVSCCTWFSHAYLLFLAVLLQSGTQPIICYQFNHLLPGSEKWLNSYVQNSKLGQVYLGPPLPCLFLASHYLSWYACAASGPSINGEKHLMEKAMFSTETFKYWNLKTVAPILY